MKKKFLVLIAVLLVLTGCGRRNLPVDRPYALEVSLGEASVHAMSGGYSWSWKEGGKTQTAVADAADPREEQDNLPYLNAGVDTELKLSFDKEPAELSVMRWSSADKYSKEEQVEVTDGVLAAPQDENSYIYSVFARWEEGGKCWGTCTYNFRYLAKGVVISAGGGAFSQVAGDLSLPEVLELQAGELFAIEVTNYEDGLMRTCRSQKDMTAILDFFRGNLTTDFEPVTVQPEASYMLRMICINGSQVTVGYGQDTTSAWVLVGDAAYGADYMDFLTLWNGLRAPAVSQSAAAVNNGYVEVSKENPAMKWTGAPLYGHIRAIEENLEYDAVRIVTDPQAEGGYRLENGWADQTMPIADTCEFWVNDTEAQVFGRMNSQRFMQYIQNTQDAPVFEIYAEDGAAIGVCQMYLP